MMDELPYRAPRVGDVYEDACKVRWKVDREEAYSARQTPGMGYPEVSFVRMWELTCEGSDGKPFRRLERENDLLTALTLVEETPDE